jgi:hypothetical protein
MNLTMQDYDILPGAEVAGLIASSTTNYLITFSPIFILIAGLVLALVVITAILDMLRPPLQETNQPPRND